MFRPQFGLASVGPDGRARFGALRHLYLGATAYTKRKLQLAGDQAERIAEISADQAKRGDGCYCDQGGDQGVLDCRNAACIPDQPELCPAFDTFALHLAQKRCRVDHLLLTTPV
jgi:hypothetical protein